MGQNQHGAVLRLWQTAGGIERASTGSHNPAVFVK
jgi:hypothetical protein